MQTGLQTEVVLCPNCREEVPKTLYCLNCGYPLYKMDLDLPKHEEENEEEDIGVEVEPEPFSLEPLTKLVESADVALNIEELAIVPTIEETEETENEPEQETVMEITELVEPPMQEVADEVVESEEPEPLEEAEEEVAEPAIVIVEVATEDITEEEVIEPLEVVEEAVIEPLEVVEEAVIETIIEEPVVETEAEPEPVFEPEPVIREVMENLAKNISTKIKLVNLLREGGVKMETFNRLFESYVARGELLMNSRNEMLERVRFDIESMERALNEAKIGLEELKIRKAIGDASEEEYRAKSPGFEWDIKQYEDEVARKRAETKYLEDLTQVMNAGEIEELKLTGENNCEAVDGLSDAGKIGAEMATRVKVALEEALAYLKVSCC